MPATLAPPAPMPPEGPSSPPTAVFPEGPYHPQHKAFAEWYQNYGRHVPEQDYTQMLSGPIGSDVYNPIAGQHEPDLPYQDLARNGFDFRNNQGQIPRPLWMKPEGRAQAEGPSSQVLLEANPAEVRPTPPAPTLNPGFMEGAAILRQPNFAEGTAKKEKLSTRALALGRMALKKTVEYVRSNQDRSDDPIYQAGWAF